AERHVAIPPARHAEELAMTWAVHLLEAELPVLVQRDEDVLLVLAPVARGLPEARLVDERRLDLDVAALGLNLAVERDELVEEHGALREPEGRPGRDRIPVVEPELAAELAVVARLRLLDAAQVLRSE